MEKPVGLLLALVCVGAVLMKPALADVGRENLTVPHAPTSENPSTLVSPLKTVAGTNDGPDEVTLSFTGRRMSLYFPAGTRLETPLWIVGAALPVALIMGWLWRRYRRSGRLGKVVAAESRTHQQARAAYNKAKTALGKKNGGTLVIDIVHDLSDRPAHMLGAEEIANEWITFDEAMDVINKIRWTKKGDAIDIVLHTLGGYSLAAELIAMAVHERGGRIRAYVPYIAMSGGNMVAMATGCIVMGKYAALSPIDTQYAGGFSAADFNQLLDVKQMKDIRDAILLEAFGVQRDQKTEFARIRALLHAAHTRRSAADQIIETLAGGELPHSERIGRKRAKEIGLNISDDCPQEVYDLVEAKLKMIETHRQRVAAAGRQSAAAADTTSSDAPQNQSLITRRFA